MTVFVNERPCVFAVMSTLAELLRHFAPPSPYAVACNGAFVPASDFHSLILSEGDTIEIVQPSAGG